MSIVEEVAITHLKKLNPEIVNTMILNNESIVKKYKLDNPKNPIYNLINLMLVITPVSKDDFNLNSFVPRIKLEIPELYKIINNKMGLLWLESNLIELQNVFVK